MTLDTTTLVAIAVMAVAAALCRLSGFWFMRLIPITPRLAAGLDAIPLAVMIGIILPPVLRGGIPESVGLVATVMAMRLTGNDFVAVITGIGSVAAARWLLV